jgi:hypothetical protein
MFIYFLMAVRAGRKKSHVWWCKEIASLGYRPPRNDIPTIFAVKGVAQGATPIQRQKFIM